ncbi:MAG: prolyl oligopeptidase family serine peptidase [Longimicrobiales bacterium]
MDNLRGFTTLVSLALLVPATADAQSASGAAGRKPLDHDAYDIWNRIDDEALSNDGAWALYGLESEQNDPALHVASLNGSESYAVERGEAGVFTDDTRFVVFRLKPSKAAVEEAEKEEKKPDQMPKDSLGILDLASGEIVRAARLDSFKLPEDAGGWLAYRLAKEPEQPDSAEADSAATPEPAPPGGRGEPEEQEEEEDDDEEKEEGTTLVLRNLDTGAERSIAHVTLYEFSRDGARLVYATSTKDGSGDGAFVVETATGETRTLMTGEGEYKGIAFDSVGQQAAFLANAENYEADQPDYTVYHWDADAQDSARAVAATADAPEGWWVSEHGELTFSASGERLFFGTAPRPEPEPEDSTVAEDEEVVVDIWAWTDPYLQPMQLERVEQETRRSYRAVVDLGDGRIVQLATEEVPEVELADRGDADFVLGQSDLPYRRALSWGESGTDYYVINARTGSSERIATNTRNNLNLSPTGKYATWFDGEQRQWFVLDLETRESRVLSEGVPHPVYNELDDRPEDPGSYGSAGWVEGETAFLIYDRHDIWALDPEGATPPRNVTDGVGRRDNLRFRYVDLDPDAREIDADAEMLLSAFDLWTKERGFYRDQLNGDAEPGRLLMADRSFGSPRKARDADVVMLTRAGFDEFPDLHMADASFSALTRISQANPQQSEYSWGTAELVDWRSAEGTILQGVLYKPEGFDPSQQHPMLVYFYERLSDGLHRHMAPAAGSSSINISFYVSRGYLVFTPDIPYQIGYPGESAVEAIVPGVLSLIDQGFVDPQRIGLQGHSWGGYQIAYMLTKTDLFAAAEAGAPVSNMISAYGGIRWSSGMSRMFQYEKTQSRIGGTLWEKPLHFIENSPIFRADKVQTPLLMLHNDEDGAVPWEQGIEYFVALRRLDKPVWMLNYNGEDHGLRKEQNRKDWTIRMQQFFDHYLKDAPPPVWMVEGVPAIKKGKTLGLELVEEITDPAIEQASNGRR